MREGQVGKIMGGTSRRRLEEMRDEKMKEARGNRERKSTRSDGK